MTVTVFTDRGTPVRQVNDIGALWSLDEETRQRKMDELLAAVAAGWKIEKETETRLKNEDTK